MPMINVQVAAERTDDLTRSIASVVERATAGILRKDPAFTALAVRYVAPSDWFVAGESLAEQRKSAFYVEIGVTEGTNSKDEKAEYVRAIFAGMEQVLGDVHPTSYVLADEVRADGYGYAGRTQERRYVEARPDRPLATAR